MKILLVNTNVSRCMRHGPAGTPVPAGLVSLAGSVKKAGHDVRIIQLQNHVLKQDEKTLPLVRQEIEQHLRGFPADVIGLSARNIGAARKPANPFHLVEYFSVFYDERIIRAFRMLTSAPVVIGGTAFSIAPELYMKWAKPDYGLIGEGEETFPALLSAIEHGVEPEGIAGLVASVADAPAALANPGRVRDLASLPIGACAALDKGTANYASVAIQTKRGCALKCIFCETPVLEGCEYRYRPLEKVIEEIRAYRDLWGVTDFFITGGTFNHTVEHGLAVCDAFLSANLGIKWHAEFNHGHVTEELCARMARAGCTGVTIGVESFSDTVLEAYGKLYRIGDMLNTFNLLRKYGLPFECSTIIGGPGETLETFAEGIAFAEKHLADDFVRFHHGMTITQHAPVFQRAVDEGVIDPTVPFEDLILSNDFRRLKSYEYFFPHCKLDPKELQRITEAACCRHKWVLTSKDFVPDPETGEFVLSPDISVVPGDNPWWKRMTRKG